MCDCRLTEPHTSSFARVPSVQRLVDQVEVRPQNSEPDDEAEEKWQQTVHGLQEWVCDLLIRNQELRMLLQTSAKEHGPEETDQ